jgi:hypothetical protein
MKKSLLIPVLILTINISFSQVNNIYQKGLTAEQNLKAIFNLTVYSTGGAGYDLRYEGIKGSTRLFDTLQTSFLKIKGDKEYVELKTDIDALNNSLVFNHPKTGKLVSIPSDIIEEVVIKSGDKDLIFRTTEANKFEKAAKGEKFIQVLKEAPNMFIKLPVKVFIQADYKGAYTSNKRYDEYETNYRYYIVDAEGSFHKILLNKKSLTKLFPEKKDIINRIAEEKAFKTDEEMVLLILQNL